jgi:hypothetical protein
MKFRLGDIYTFADGPAAAVVIQIHSDGRAGLMRFADTHAEEWLLWAELQQEGKWRQKQKKLPGRPLS